MLTMHKRENESKPFPLILCLSAPEYFLQTRKKEKVHKRPYMQSNIKFETSALSGKYESVRDA